MLYSSEYNEHYFSMQKVQKNYRLGIPVENLYLILQIPVNPVFKEKKFYKIPFVSPNKILIFPLFVL